MSIVLQLLQGGWNALLEYLSAHVLTCLVPAFFIAGAIAVFVSQTSVLKYFGPHAKKLLSYSVASVSGTILAVCSCAFLYSGPAINVLAIVYTARILGFDLGLARAIGAVAFAAGIGLIMATIYRKEESLKDTAAFDALMADPESKKWWQQVAFFAVLVGILVSAASKNWIITGVLLVALALILWRWFTKSELGIWMKETLRFVRLIVPWLRSAPG
jgi:uncharacterized membrane protein YraQ (UPF0718 family)